jgi:peptide/nickel transport system permease protein
MAGSTPASLTAEAAAASGRPKRAKLISPWGEAWRRFRRHRLAIAGLVILAVIVLAVLVGPWLYPVPINDIDFEARLKGPMLGHPFGTDDLGQDLLARMLYGGRISLAVGLMAMMIAVVIGTIVGAIAGISRGSVDAALMWVTDLFLSLPQLPLLLLIIYLFRDSLKAIVGVEAGIFIMIVAVIGGFRWMPVARLVRAQFLSIREKEYVEAARALGVSQLRLVARHILPNSLGPVIIAGTIDVAVAIIAESTLSFLGLGFPPDIPTWAASSMTRRITSTSRPTGRSSPAWRSSSRCCRSTTSATGCATRSIRAASCDRWGQSSTRRRMRPVPQGGSSKFAVSRPISRRTRAWCTRSTAWTCISTPARPSGSWASRAVARA